MNWHGPVPVRMNPFSPIAAIAEPVWFVVNPEGTEWALWRDAFPAVSQ